MVPSKGYSAHCCYYFKVVILFFYLLTNVSYLHAQAVQQNIDTTKSLPVDLGSVLPKHLVINDPSVDLDKPIGSMVSVVRIGNDYLLADYANIYRFIPNAGQLQKMSPILNLAEVMKKSVPPSTVGNSYTQKPIWVPTGLLYEEKTNLLYVANYLANNILIFKPNLKNNQLILKDVIHTSNTISPENLAMSADGKWLVSANYDGNSIVCFHKNDKDVWQEEWMLPVGFAHGVAINGSTVYGLSLKDRAILAIELKTGVLKHKTGSQGWDPRLPQFLWPTAVTYLGNGRLAVSDAHTGRISILNDQTLGVQSWFGANGPGWRFLNMPYAVVKDGMYMLLLSTYQNRLIKINLANFKVVDSWIFSTTPNKWKNFNIFSESSTIGANGSYIDYTNEKGPTLSIGGINYSLAYRYLFPTLSNVKAPILSAGDGLFNRNNDFYYIQVTPNDDSSGFALTSPQVGSGIFYTNVNGRSYLTCVNQDFGITVDTWSVQGKLFSPIKELDLNALNIQAKAQIAKLEGSRTPDGILNKDILLKTVVSGCHNENEFSERFDATFSSSIGKKFLAEYKLWESNQASAQQVIKAASDYFSKAPIQKNLSFSEFVLIQMLTNQVGRLVQE